MGDFLRRLKQHIKKDYAITVEIYLDEIPVHQTEVSVTDYNKSRAMKRAIKYVESVATVKAVGAKVEK